MKKIDKAYEYIRDYIAEKDYPPTIREIADAIGVKSTSTISYYLQRLEETNKIVKGSYKNRSIQLVETLSTKFSSADIITLPLIKSVTLGKSLKSEQNIGGKYMMSGNLFNGLDMFIITVEDDMMKNSAILKGDMVVVSRQNVARNGEIVVALVNGRYQVARLFREFNFFKLKFDSEGSEPIFLEKMVLLGKVVGVIRNQID